MLYESQEKVFNLFADYSTIVSEVKHTSIYGKGIKILNHKQIFKRLLIALTQIQTGNKFENFLN